jgi:uncharacterized integral membrane protein
MDDPVAYTHQYAALVLGFAFSTLGGHLLVRFVVGLLRKRIATDRDPTPEIFTSVQGMVERVLYTGSLYSGQPALVGVWLVLKTASQFKRWGAMPGHMIFLVGSGLSLIYAAVGARMIEWTLTERWSSLITYPVAVVLGTLVLGAWIGHAGPSSR